jgi:hypothetical protein
MSYEGYWHLTIYVSSHMMSLMSIWILFLCYITKHFHHGTSSQFFIFFFNFLFFEINKYYFVCIFMHIKWLYPLLLKWFLNYVFFTIKTMSVNEDVFLACVFIFLGNVVQMLYNVPKFWLLNKLLKERLFTMMNM